MFNIILTHRLRRKGVRDLLVYTTHAWYTFVHTVICSYFGEVLYETYVEDVHTFPGKWVTSCIIKIIMTN